MALIPLTTARRQFTGMSRASPRLVHNVTVKFSDEVSAEDTMAAIRDLLRQRHRLQSGQDESFLVSNLAEAANVEQTTTRVLSILLAAVASVSLVVGGIGIMNIMLVTVTERTREIGLRLAVVPRQRDVVHQFLIEAMTLSVLGGGLGALLGICSALAVALIAGWSVLIEFSTLLLAVGFAGAVGLFFGLYPAWQAARLDPVVALRHE